MPTLPLRSMPAPTKHKPKRPTTGNSSRQFDDAAPTASARVHTNNSRRPADYALPLDLGNSTSGSNSTPAQGNRKRAQLTEENLRLLDHLEGERRNSGAPPSSADRSVRFGHRTNHTTAAEQIPKSSLPPKKKSATLRKSKADDHSHPLNLPPDQLHRLSAAMACEEARNGTPMNLDEEVPSAPASDPAASAGAGAGGATASPTQEGPSQLPSEHDEADGSDAKNGKSPTPPPHRSQPPKVDPEACKAAGNKFFKAKDYDRAVQEYSKAVDADPSNPTYLSNRAAAYMSAGKYESALFDSLAANRLDSGNEKILHRLARIYTSLGRPQDALDTYARIPSASATDTAPARQAQHSIEMAQKQIDAADGNGNMALWSIEQAKQTLGPGTPMPRNWQILRAKANLKVDSVNSLGEAQAITQALMRQNPSDAEAIALAGRSFYLKDDKGVGKSDYERAEQYFRQALSFDPDNTDARNWLRTMKKLQRARDEANDFFKRGNYSEAVDRYTAALEIDPSNKITNAKLLGNRALSNLKLKNYDEACSDCDRALKLDPTYAKAKRTRAKAVGEGGDWEQAVRDLKSLSEEDPGDNDLARELRNAEIELKKSKRKDYYKILGVDKDAGDKDIEKAYKRKAALLHPDKTQGDEEKTKQFKDCLEAKEILTDPQKRHLYDQGIDPNDPTSGMGGGGPGGFHGGAGGGVQIDPEILMQMFGGGGMGGGRGFPGGMGGGGFPGGFSFSSGGPGMGGGRGGGAYPFG